MKKIITKLLNFATVTVVLGSLGAAIFNTASPVYACSSAGDCASQGLSQACSGSNCGSSSPASVNSTIVTVINVLSAIVGAAAIIMIIIGGFRYVISGGDSNSVNGAKNAIIYALVGLVVVVSAQAIVRFVLHKV